ncbi:MAG: hypothetical protein FWD41_02890 [Actinomycetia bacterium]|nr:hypothetical protein [Actinomycetes bacterium]
MLKLTGKVTLLTAVIIAMLIAPTIASALEQSLTTTLAGGNGNDGIMFDIVAKKDLIIKSLDAFITEDSEDEVPGQGTIVIYYKPGTHVGAITNPGAWSLVGTASVYADGAPPTPIPIDLSSIIMSPGDRGALYITFVPSDDDYMVEYTDGTAFDSVFVEDDALQILEGTGLPYLFDPDINQPRVFNGTIHYELLDMYDLTATAEAGGSVAPDSGHFRVGTTVTVTATPDPGYHFTGWLITWPGDLPASVDVYANPLVFDMPEGDVAVVAQFAKDEPKPPTPPVPPVKPVIPPTGDSMAVFVPLLTVIAGLVVASVPTLRKRRQR